MEVSLHNFWPRAERKLYEEPKRLVEHGLAELTRDLVGRRPRTTYRPRLRLPVVRDQLAALGSRISTFGGAAHGKAGKKHRGVRTTASSAATPTAEPGIDTPPSAWPRPCSS